MKKTSLTGKLISLHTSDSKSERTLLANLSVFILVTAKAKGLLHIAEAQSKHDVFVRELISALRALRNSGGTGVIRAI